MPIQSVLFIIINYLNYKSLNNLSQVIEIPKYIWTRFLDNKYGYDIDSKELVEFLNKNSIKLKEKRRLDIVEMFKAQDIIFDTTKITRLFYFY